MAVGRQIAGRANRLDKTAKDVEMALGGVHDHHVRLGKPAGKHVESLRWLEGVGEEQRTRGKPEEREQH